MDGVQWAPMDALRSGETLYRTGMKTFDLPHHAKTEDLVTFLTDESKPVDYGKMPYGTTLHTLHELSKIQYGRRMACSTNRRLALTPDLTEKGDHIAILHGSRVPVVLRGRPNGKFVVIGPCYYDGGMYGEMADQKDEDADIMTLV